MTLTEEIQLRIDIYGGREVLAREIDREWGFFLGGKNLTIAQRKRGATLLWSSKDTQYLLKWYKRTNISVLSRRLGRSKFAIMSRMHYLQNKKTA